jgi:hypothetical protein
LAEGAISPAHASVLAHGTHDLPAQLTTDAEPVLVEAARRLDPARLRRVVAHLRHWLHGGPTDLANLALVCRAHHRAVHEGGWQLARAPDGRLTATHPTDHSKDTRPPPDRRTNADHQTGGEPGRGCAEERSSNDPTHRARYRHGAPGPTTLYRRLRRVPKMERGSGGRSGCP